MHTAVSVVKVHRPRLSFIRSQGGSSVSQTPSDKHEVSDAAQSDEEEEESCLDMTAIRVESGISSGSERVGRNTAAAATTPPVEHAEASGATASEVEALKKENYEKDKKLKEQSEALAAKDKELKELDDGWNFMNVRVQELVHELEETKGKKHKKDAMAAKLGLVEEENKELQKENKRLKDDLAKLRTEKNKLVDDISNVPEELVDKLTKLQKKAFDLEAENKQLKKGVKEHEEGAAAEKAKSNLALKRMQEELGEARSSKDKLAEELSKARREVAEQKRKVSDQEAELGRLRKRLAENLAANKQREQQAEVGAEVSSAMKLDGQKAEAIAKYGTTDKDLNESLSEQHVGLAQTTILRGPRHVPAQVRSATVPSVSTPSESKLIDLIGVDQNTARQLLRDSNGDLNTAAAMFLSSSQTAHEVPAQRPTGPRVRIVEPEQPRYPSAQQQRVFVIRHGERGDTDDFISTSRRPYDPPLTAGGRAQARKVGTQLADMLRGQVVVIISSPYERCFSTAKGIAEQVVGAEIMVHYGLSEQHTEATTMNKRDHRWVPAFDTSTFDGHHILASVLPPYPEPQDHFQQRVLTTLNDLIPSLSSSGTLILVTHGPFVVTAAESFFAPPHQRRSISCVEYCSYIDCTWSGRAWMCKTSPGVEFYS
eukprot:TRINITY_DN3997_c0_g2_i2.p1 TRINITY_DN3997_c0_g2~~TRINITY_DN3997_c0_g2_i2.p1  ORF type:complete len:655 (+),score=148.55 TRINITY_DN3997_c0_g2_i2:901-2865(+)